MRHLTILALTLGLVAGAAPALATPVELTILHTNDTHSHLVPYDTRTAKQVGGIARRATLIASIKKAASRVLVLDAGDTFQGTPIFNFFSGEPEFLSLDLAGYDATTVGNHDLDNGLPNMIAQHKGRRFPILCANLVDPKTSKPIFTASRIYERDGLKIAVFGIIGKAALDAVAIKNQVGMTFVPPERMVQATVDALRSQADVVLMLSHSGYQEDLAMARQFRGIDVIIGGHSHTRIDTPTEVVNGAWKTLIVQDFQWGENLGRLDLKVEAGRVVAYDGKLLPITSEIAEDAKIAALVNRYDGQITAKMNVVIGQSDKGLSWDGKYLRDCEVGSFAADVIRERCKADVGIMNAGGLRAYLTAGPVTVGQIFQIFPFDNALEALDMDGQTLQELLDSGVRLKKPGMMQYSNLTFRAKDGKAVDVLVGGVPLDPKKSYRIGTIDYLAQGNDGYTLFLRGTNVTATGVVLRDAVLDAVKAHPQISTPALGRIKVD